MGKTNLFTFELTKPIEIKGKARKFWGLLGLVILIVCAVLSIFISTLEHKLNFLSLSAVLMTFLFVGYVCIEIAFPNFNKNIMKWALRIFCPLFALEFFVELIKSIERFDMLSIKDSVISVIGFAGFFFFFLVLSIRGWKEIIYRSVKEGKSR